MGGVVGEPTWWTKWAQIWDSNARAQANKISKLARLDPSFTHNDPMVIYCDHTSAQYIVTNLVRHERNKILKLIIILTKRRSTITIHIQRSS